MRQVFSVCLGFKVFGFMGLGVFLRAWGFVVFGPYGFHVLGCVSLLKVFWSRWLSVLRVSRPHGLRVLSCSGFRI